MDAGGPLGVKLEYFPKFIRDWNISCTDTTIDVCEKIVKKETEVGDLRFIDLIPVEFRGKAEAFVSHAWNQPFTRVTDLLLKGRISSRYNSSIFVWFDLFVVHQNGGQKQKKDLESIHLVIKSCDYTILLLDQPSGHDRPVLLTRMWCLYEIYRTQQSGGKFVMVFDRPFRSNARIPWLRIEEGKITKPEDKEMILADVGDNAGEVNLILNQMVHQVWVIRSTGRVLLSWFIIWSLIISIVMKLDFINLGGILFSHFLMSGFATWYYTIMYMEGIWFFGRGCFSRETSTFLLLATYYIVTCTVLSIDKFKLHCEHWWAIYGYIAFKIFLVSLPICLGAIFSGYCATFNTELGAILWFLLVPIFLDCMSVFFATKYLCQEVYSHELLIGIFVGDIVLWLCLLTISWFAYFRYRKLNHAVQLRSEHGCCWKILWTVLSLGVEPLVNGCFVRGMRHPNELQIPLL